MRPYTACFSYLCAYPCYDYTLFFVKNLIKRFGLQGSSQFSLESSRDTAANLISRREKRVNHLEPRFTKAKAGHPPATVRDFWGILTSVPSSYWL